MKPHRRTVEGAADRLPFQEAAIGGRGGSLGLGSVGDCGQRDSALEEQVRDRSSDPRAAPTFLKRPEKDRTTLTELQGPSF